MTKEERAASIALDVLKEPIIACEAITGQGSVNVVYAVTTGTQQVIVRMREGARAEYEKEAWCYRRAGQAGPSVVRVGEDGEAAYLVLTRVAGLNGADIPDKLNVWQTLGEYARRIHAIPVSGFGNVVADADGDRFGNSHAPS